MRFCGSSEPARRSGPFGHEATALNPARMAARYCARSAALRPGARFMFAVSPCSKRVSASAGVDVSLAPLDFAGVATSPAALFVLSGVAAFALALVPQPASATAPAAHESIRTLRKF